MRKILFNKQNTTITLVDEKIDTDFDYFPAERSTFWKKSKPERWVVLTPVKRFAHTYSREWFDTSKEYKLVNNVAYEKSKMVYRLMDKRVFTIYFDNYEDALSAYELVKNTKEVDLEIDVE